MYEDFQNYKKIHGKIKKIETLKLSKIELPKENLKKSNPLVQYQITIHCGVSGVINIVICCYSCYSCAQHDAPLWAEALCF